MVQMNVQGETSASFLAGGEDYEDEGPVFLEEEDNSGTDDDIEGH